MKNSGNLEQAKNNHVNSEAGLIDNVAMPTPKGVSLTLFLNGGVGALFVRNPFCVLILFNFYIASHLLSSYNLPP